MAETATGKKSTIDVQKILTDKVIEKLRNGIVPWRVPWTKAGLPENLISHHAYQGINRILLASLGYERNLFLTSKQLKEIGGTLIPDERPHVIGYLSSPNTAAQSTEAAEVPVEITEAKKPTQLRYYTVFNIAQCAIPAATPIPPVVLEAEPIQDIVEVKSKEQKFAYYDPLKDFINMPKDSQFDSKAERCHAHFHQLIHSTGHHGRLNRKGLIQMPEFGYDAFSQEELIAEIGASYLLSHYGIALPWEPSPAYLAGWVKKLEGDKWFMYSAAYHAEKAINFLFIGELEAIDMRLE